MSAIVQIGYQNTRKSPPNHQHLFGDDADESDEEVKEKAE